LLPQRGREYARLTNLRFDEAVVETVDAVVAVDMVVTLLKRVWVILSRRARLAWKRSGGIDWLPAVGDACKEDLGVANAASVSSALRFLPARRRDVNKSGGGAAALSFEGPSQTQTTAKLQGKDKPSVKLPPILPTSCTFHRIPSRWRCHNKKRTSVCLVEVKQDDGAGPAKRLFTRVTLLQASW